MKFLNNFLVVFLLFVSEVAFSAVRSIPKPDKLKPITPTKVIRVKDGDLVEMTAGFVKQKIQGKWVTRLAYNGSIPGPTIIAPKGSKIKLKLTNLTGEPTTLHSHGLRVDDKNDGVVGIGQGPILHGKSHLYELRFWDSGLYWYHPHMSDEYGQEMGLQGNYWVTESDPGILPKVDREEVVVIDDIIVENNELPSFRSTAISYALMGRYGTKQFINNRVSNDSLWRSETRVGEVVRYWLTNTANARPFKIKFSGGQMKLVGSDNGFYERDMIVDEVILSPSERAIVDIFYSESGVIKIENVGPAKPVLLGEVKVGKNPKLKLTDIEILATKFKTVLSRSSIKSEFDNYRKLQSAKPDITMKIDATLRGAHAEHMMGGAAHGEGIEWDDNMPGMNAEMTEKEVTWRIIDAADGKENMDINWIFKKNIPTKIRIVNDGKTHPMQHPMHFHGQRFVVLARNNQPQENLVWKDTALISAGETMDVVLDNQNVGRWMGHCHISEHLGTGMMFGFEVRE